MGVANLLLEAALVARLPQAVEQAPLLRGGHQAGIGHGRHMEAHPRLQQAAYGQERQLPELTSCSRPLLKSLCCLRFQGDPHVDVAMF